MNEKNKVKAKKAKNTNEANKANNKNKARVIIFLVILVSTILVAVSLVPKGTESYRIVNTAINNSESLSDFLMEYETRTIVNYGDATRDIATVGHFVSLDNREAVAVELNTESYYSYDENLNSKVSATFFSEDGKVYDITSGSKKTADISYEDFKKTLDNFSLYRYSPSKVKDEQLVKNEKKELKASNITVSLDSVEDAVLESYAKEISVLTEDDVKASELTPVAAYVQYNIYDDKILNQTYTFTVEYKASNNEVLKYTVISTISYIEDFTDEDVDEYIPFDITE